MAIHSSFLVSSYSDSENRTLDTGSYLLSDQFRSVSHYSLSLWVPEKGRLTISVAQNNGLLDIAMHFNLSRYRL